MKVKELNEQQDCLARASKHLSDTAKQLQKAGEVFCANKRDDLGLQLFEIQKRTVSIREAVGDSSQIIDNMIYRAEEQE